MPKWGSLVLSARTTSLLGALTQRLKRMRFPAAVQRFGARAWQGLRSRFPVAVSSPAAGVSSPQAGAPPRAPASEEAPPSTVTIGAWIDDLRRAPDFEERVSAARRLADVAGEGVAGEGVVDALLDALNDPSAEVAVSALDALSRTGDPRAAPALASVLTNAEGYFSPLTRAAAVVGLARCSGPAAVPLLSEALTDVDAEVSLSAIAALAEVGPGMATTRLAAILTDETGYFLPAVRLAAAHALGAGGASDPDLATALLASERDPEVRAVLARG
jgi:hypothetical protein